MAAKTQYTKDFKEKVVREYKNGNLSIDDVAAKYGIPAALLQDWVNLLIVISSYFYYKNNWLSSFVSFLLYCQVHQYVQITLVPHLHPLDQV